MDMFLETVGSDVTTAINAVITAAFLVYKLIKKWRS